MGNKEQSPTSFQEGLEQRHAEFVNKDKSDCIIRWRDKVKQQCGSGAAFHHTDVASMGDPELIGPNDAPANQQSGRQRGFDLDSSQAFNHHRTRLIIKAHE